MIWFFSYFQISGIHSLDEVSEISEEVNSAIADSGRGSSDPDITNNSNYFCKYIVKQLITLLASYFYIDQENFEDYDIK